MSKLQISKTKYTLLLRILVSYLYGIGTFAIAQTPKSSFNINNTVTCINENLLIENSSINSIDFNWDFCEGDLNEIPSGTDMGSISFSLAPESIELVKDGINWFGFITSTGNDQLILANFGNNLNNIPTYTNLGDFGGLLSKPTGIITSFENSNWVSLIISSELNPKLIRWQQPVKRACGRRFRKL